MQYGEIYSTDSDSFRGRTAHVPFRASACAGDHESILFPLFRTSLTSVTAETEAMDASKVNFIRSYFHDKVSTCFWPL